MIIVEIYALELCGGCVGPAALGRSEDSRRLLALSGELLAPVPGLVPRGASLSSVLQEAVGDLCVISLGWGLNSMGGAGPWGCSDCGPAPVCSGCPWPSG